MKKNEKNEKKLENVTGGMTWKQWSDGVPLVKGYKCPYCGETENICGNSIRIVCKNCWEPIN